MSTDNLEQKAIDLLDKLESLATEYTPAVYDTAVSVAQINALSDIIYSIAGIIYLAFSYIGFRWIFRTIHNLIKDDKEPSEAQGAGILIIGLAGFIASIHGIFNISGLWDVWSWAALFNPELGLARQVLGI